MIIIYNMDLKMSF